MSYLDLALSLAQGGWPVFPTGRDKRPVPGFTRWEERSTTDPETIRQWWAEHPEAIPAVTPGKVFRTVIDVDRHPGGADGVQSLKDAGIRLNKDAPIRLSLSGNGYHIWLKGRTSTTAGLLPGVDRRSVGGYACVVYQLPPVNEVTVRVPTALQGSKLKEATEARYSGTISEWVEKHAGLTPSLAVNAAMSDIEPGSFCGHERMMRLQAKLVGLAAAGHGGVPEALERAREAWAVSPHASEEDPYIEWDQSLRGAIRRFGGESR